MRVLELFCGIGGCAAAGRAGELRADIVGAVDIHPGALDVYAHNFPRHPLVVAEIAALSAERLRAFDADLWWMSPPCQPFTRRGFGRGLEDPRCRALRSLTERIGALRPDHVALENVPEFAGSDAHELLRDTLLHAEYEIREWTLCPSQMGAPNRRRRFYLLASRKGLRREEPPPNETLPLRVFLDPEADEDSRLILDPAVRDAYRDALHVVDAEDEDAMTACFTSAYGRSPVRSGSYLRLGEHLRRFSPLEILRLLGFPPDYGLPELPPRKAWPLVGNSLSLFCVRYVLKHLP